MQQDEISCQALQRVLLEQERELTPAEARHLSGCEECLDALLTFSLEEKPQPVVPDDFAARVAAGLPKKQVARLGRPRYLGLSVAVFMLTVVAVIVFLVDPRFLAANSEVGITFMLLVVAEIAGIALWLAPLRLWK